MIKELKKISVLAFVAVAAVLMAGCEPKAEETTGSTTTSSRSAPQGTASNETTSTEPKSEYDGSLANAQLSGSSQAKQTNPASAVPVDARKPKDGEEVVVMETEMGKIIVMFFPDKAPKHVENFKKLTKEGFYNGTKFHRTIPNFMIQGGDPNTKTDDRSTYGQGNPGYTVDAEFNDVKHVAGILSMARSSDPNSAGSQFFIMVGTAPSLDGSYTAFGKVVSGQEVADKIVSQPTEGPQNDQAVKPIAIKKATVVKWPVK